MQIKDKENSVDRVELKGFLAEFRGALEEEINKIKKSGQSSTLLFSGRQIEARGIERWYRFGVEYVPTVPADTPCKLIIGKEQYDVTVVSFEENSIVLSSKNVLPDTLTKARLENGATVLMERLIKCIEENADKDNPVGNRMISTDGSIYHSKKIFEYNDINLKLNNTQSQNDAIVSALSNDITYIWGPPGTGKTTVIGQIIDELYKHNRSVLVVSHTNTAVDGAIEKAYKTYSKSNNGTDENCPILRIGVPSKDLPEKVMLSYHVAELGKELYERKDALEKLQKELQSRISEIQPILAKDNWIKESNLKYISESLRKISSYEKELAEIQCEIEIINVSLAEEKTVHPEYANFLILSKTLKAKKNDYADICDKVKQYEKSIDKLSQDIQNSQDEEKKHSIYANLLEQQSKYMSESFLKKEINNVSAQIINLQHNIDNLMSQQIKAQQFISDYEKKNSIAKLLVNKNSVSQNYAVLEQIRIELPAVNEELFRKQNLKNEYSQQLEKLFLLQEQMKAVTPSKTPYYWRNQACELQVELRTVQKELKDLFELKNSIYEVIREIEEQQSNAKVSFDTISDLGRKYRREKDNLDAIKVKYNEEYRICFDKLEKELSLCIDFYDCSLSEDVSVLYDELSNVFDVVKKEIKSIDIGNIKKEKEEISNQIIENFRQLNELKEKMQELEKQAIENAKIVGATLAKTYLSATLRERKFDTVILDEASMASIPALWCASYLAEKSIVIVGDFLQLPPIVMADTPMAQKWLGKDIFYHSGMQGRARNKATCPENFVMLNNQFRMESDIANIANMYYGAYGGLQSDDNNEYRVKDRKKFYDWFPSEKGKENIHLVDTESLHAWVTGVPQGKSHSRLNCFSAAVCVDLAFEFLENKLKEIDPNKAQPTKEASVLIVAPYKPHISRINQLIDLEYHNRGYKENLNLIRAGTIHSFQGSEADIVIFDLVIDEPHWKANLFMTDKEVNEDLRKMFNVAVTRAKFKLYVVGNFSYCQKRAKNNALSELLDKLINEKHLVKENAKELIPNIEYTRQSEFSFDGNIKGKHIVCREDIFNNYFMNEISSFKKRLIIYSAFMTEARLSTLIPAFADAINKGKQIVVVTKALSDRGKSEVSQYKKCEDELRAIGVNVIHKKGMHEKLIFVDSKAVWIGSLNALSFTGLTGEIMQRHEDRDLTAEYEKLFDIEHICETIEKTYEQRCPICGDEMLVKESDEGGIYWQCVNEDYSRNTSQQYPQDGILRCKCGAPYVFAMKNEPRWVCSEDPKHYQKMREGDLKLEKMAALIPTKKARKDVDLYFAQRRKERESTKKKIPQNTKSKSKKLSDDVPEQLELV